MPTWEERTSDLRNSTETFALEIGALATDAPPSIQRRVLARFRIGAYSFDVGQAAVARLMLAAERDRVCDELAF
jgi:hypothetical protein